MPKTTKVKSSPRDDLFQLRCTTAQKKELQDLGKLAKADGKTMADFLAMCARMELQRRQEAATQSPKENAPHDGPWSFEEGYAAGHVAGQMAVAFAQDREASIPWGQIRDWAQRCPVAATYVVDELVSQPFAARFLAMWEENVDPGSQSA
ncbi:MAG: hypothetical protein M0Z47_10775 [Actinomycetota bacterium]|nr:hypothetical protein [Actinomycetota bacterium]